MTRRGQGPLIVTGNPDPDVQRKLLPAARLIVQTQPRYALSPPQLFECELGNLRCAYRKSDPAILMVQAAQDRAADDIPGPLNAAMDGGILVQGQMSARGVVVIFVRQQNVAQMAFAEDYDMINAFPSD